MNERQSKQMDSKNNPAIIKKKWAQLSVQMCMAIGTTGISFWTMAASSVFGSWSDVAMSTVAFVGSVAVFADIDRAINKLSNRTLPPPTPNP